MTQSELAAPLSKGFVSAVENGQALPSLGALWLFAGRLEVPVGSLVDDVNGIATAEYTLPHEPQERSDRAIRAGGASSSPDRR